MFNEAQKKQYMKESEIRNVHIVDNGSVIFNRIEAEEMRLGKDCCNFSVEEIIAFYRKLMTTSYHSLANLNSQYSLYTSWCVDKRYVKDGINHYAEIGSGVLRDCVNKGLLENKVITRKELLSLFNKSIENPCDQFLLLGLFEGIYGVQLCEFYELSTNDFKGNTVHLKTGREFEVSDRLIAIAKESQDTYYRKPYSANPVKDVKLKDDDPYIIKLSHNSSDVGGVKAFHRRCENSLKMCAGIAEFNFTPPSLKESGRIHMIKEYMAKEKGDWKTVYERHVDDLDYRFGSIKSKLLAYERSYGQFLT